MTAPQLFAWVKGTKRSADLVAHSKIKATLLVHGVVDSWEFRKLWPFMFEGVVQQTVICVYVSPQLLPAAHGPVVSVEGCLHQGSHHAAHGCLIATAVSLAIMFHTQDMSSFVSHNKSRGESIFMIQCAASDRVAHPSDWSVPLHPSRSKALSGEEDGMIVVFCMVHIAFLLSERPAAHVLQAARWVSSFNKAN